MLVTGGASGLGAALAAAFAARGDEVLVGDINEPTPAVEDEARPSRNRHFLKLDVRSDDDWAAAARVGRRSTGAASTCW